MKKLGCILIMAVALLALPLALSACGGNTAPAPAPAPAPGPAAETPAAETPAAEPTVFAARANRDQILADIDGVIAKLNKEEISYDDAIKEIQGIIPKPESNPNYPQRDIEVIIGWGEGGSSDKYPRNIGVDAAKILGVNLVYINMPGASGDTAVAYTLTKEADGYTITGVNGSQPTTQVFFEHPYTFTEDLAPIVSNQGYSEAIFVKSDSPLQTWDDIVEYAKENGTVSISTVGVNNDDGLVVWALMEHFGIDITNIGYEKAGERISAMMGGHVDMMADSVGNVIQLVESGDVRPVLYYGDVRYDDVDPDIPCFGDYGLNISLLRWRGFAGPTALPDDIAEYLFQVFYAAQWLPFYQEFEKTNYMTYSQPWTLAPEELKEFWTEFYEEGLAMYEKYGQ